MKFPRASGILLHPTSLPGPYGIGDLGPEAYRFVDFLGDSGCRLWQILPLGPTGYGDSPYQCFSAFAGNPYLISPDFLLRDGFLHPDDLVEKMDFPDSRVDYGRVIGWKLNLLERAFLHFTSDPEPVRAEYDHFCAENASWLEDYALFMAIKESRGGGSWDGWPKSLRQRKPKALEKARLELSDTLARFSFYQFLFFRQWRALRAHANQRGVQIVGDIPIFVAYDSADVWANPELFHLDEEGLPTVVAGVPPDYFSPTGQLWGNPLYRWDVHKETGYTWWIARFRAILAQVDIVRLDHFRGFAGYWEVPFGSPTAERGRWAPGPGADLFTALDNALGNTSAVAGTGLPILAEDLGLITDDVVDLREKFQFPGMKILQFGFTEPENPFLPHNFSQNCVVYTGTHDNDTARGWYDSAPESERDFARRYLGVDGSDFAWDLIRAAWASTAVFAFTPMQDLLNIGGEGRMNYPSRLGGNWEWRIPADALLEGTRDRLRELNYLYSR